MVLYLFFYISQAGIFTILAYYNSMRNKLKLYRLQLAARAGRDISQTEFASILGVGRQQLNRYERQATQPDLETLVRIWKALKEYWPDINLQDLLE